MATGILRFSPDLVHAWLLKQLRRVSTPLAKGNTQAAPVAEPLQVESVFSADQEIVLLAHMARELEADYECVLNSLNNIHGRNLNDTGTVFAQQLGDLVAALESADYESVRARASGLSFIISDMQSNIPAWDYIRGLQLLVKRCRQL
ncbi:MAG: hypothetical protein VCA55_05195 [Verrucomicrobiales bacterium]